MDLEELGIYLRKNLSENYIKENKLDELLPKRVAKKIREKNKDKENDAYEFIEEIQDLFDESVHWDDFASDFVVTDNDLEIQIGTENSLTGKKEGLCDEDKSESGTRTSDDELDGGE